MLKWKLLKMDKMFNSFQKSSIGKFLIEKVFFRTKGFYSVILSLTGWLIFQVSAFSYGEDLAQAIQLEISTSEQPIKFLWYVADFFAPTGNLLIITILILIILSLFWIRNKELKTTNNIKEILSELKEYGKISLSDEWFLEQNKLAIDDLGARYTPEINVELEIVENFNALSRNNAFKEQIDKLYHEMMVDFRKLLNRHHVDENLVSGFEKLNTNLIDFESEYFQLNLTGIEEINFEAIEGYFNNIESISESVFELLEDLNEKEIKEKNIKTERGYRTATCFDGYISDLRNATSSLYNFKDVLTKPLIKLVNKPYMILKGEAGIGKSHLLADIINQRLEEGSDSIFLLGQQFMQEKSPWSQILNDLLRLKCNEDEFLGALNVRAEAKQKRTIIWH